MAIAELSSSRPAPLGSHPWAANARAADTDASDAPRAGEAASAVSWSAAFAGAAVAAACSLVLLALGTGLGLSAISPWPQKGVQAATFGIASIAWVIVTQLCASALGGYLAGRLRTRWTGVATDEVYFRDTAHGLLAWAVASLATAALMVFGIAGALGTATQGAATVASGAVVSGAATTTAATAAMIGGNAGAAADRPAADGGALGYLVDYLLRRDPSAPAPADGAAQVSSAQVAEVTRIFSNAMDSATLPAQDLHYLGQVVAQRTGLSIGDAESRVTQAFTGLQTRIANAKLAASVAAESARKLAIQAALWLFIALLGGAFVASYAATLGGRERDA